MIKLAKLYGHAKYAQIEFEKNALRFRDIAISRVPKTLLSKFKMLKAKYSRTGPKKMISGLKSEALEEREARRFLKRVSKGK